jgi:RES domain-containing protein
MIYHMLYQDRYLATSREIGGGRGAAVWYRIVGAHRRSKGDVLRSWGGRFHDDPQGEPTTYLADSLETAWREVSAHAGEARLDMGAFRAWRVIVPAPVLRNMVDLRRRQQLERYRITRSELQADPAPEGGKRLARRLRAEGRAGIVYWSVRNQPHGVCAAVFLGKGVEAELHLERGDEEWDRFRAQEQP